MKHIFSLLISLIVLTGALQADAQVLTAAKIKNDITSEIVKSYRKYTDAELEVSVLNVPFAELNIADGKLSYNILSNSDRFMARDIKKVEVLVNGKLSKTFVLPISVKAYKNILVAKNFIDREASITTLNTRIERKEISNTFDNILTHDKLSNELVSKKFFKENEIIDKRFVKIKPDVARNENVVAFFKTNGIMISVSATSLGDGMIGDYVVLKSSQYQKSYRGKVIGQNKVLVSI